MLNSAVRAEDPGERSRREVDPYPAESSIRGSGGAGALFFNPANCTGSALSLSLPALPALPARPWRPLNPPAALEGDLEREERRAAAGHDGSPEGPGSISDAWLRARGWRGEGGGRGRGGGGQPWSTETPGSFNRSRWVFLLVLFGSGSAAALGCR